MYAPFFGILLSLSQLRIVRKMISITPTVCAVFGFLIAVFTLVTEIRIGVFGDRMAFWEDAVKHSFHHPLAHKNLGAMLHLDGNYYGAEKEYRVALDLHPCETMVHNNLGLIYKHRKEYDKARREFMEELRINPSYADAYYNWGLMCFERGQIDEAKALWTKTLICNPHHYDAQIALSCHTLDPKAFLNSESR
jgi:tetratricopeptide (TPR) repeat protein